ncbi:MAG: protein-methionine-sulfoxide reductase catalytic subunit MsrP [Bacteroidetes bacterium]|nr:protein-methionine-sulfoxide reductase catalytic subunit MsrP [Bacteroidota bacterium]MCY4205969.1 protein-methionine-sulfoxide reductase catalytic subunit MsrP [Bacteroidota bacterium]
MANIILPPSWALKESACTSKATYTNRRKFVKSLGLGAIGLATLGGCSALSQEAVGGPLDKIPENAPRDGFPASRNETFQVPEREMTERILASSYNNFYEFINQGNLKKVWPLVDDYEPFPWTLQTRGEVEKKQKWDLVELIKSMQLEERIYRFRCVEAWSMTIPWTGFTLRSLIEKCQPKSSATHVKFICVSRPDQLPGQKKANWYPWPYFEGLRMDEALNELAFVAVGMYGEPLPKQNGSPLRLVLPWKYGYKGPKAITHIEFTRKQPGTFWNELQPREYGFLSNVNPNIPHPRWTQASERFMQSEGEERRIRTQLFNGYDEWVGDLYPDEPRSPAGPIIR